MGRIRTRATALRHHAACMPMRPWLPLLLFVRASSTSIQLFVHGPTADHATTTGTTAADGLSPATAFASIADARDLLRSLAPEQRCGATVTLSAGEYSVSSGSGLLELDARDSGCPGDPVVYTAAPGEAVTLHGGVRVPSRLFQQVVVNGIEMFRADVRPLGVSDFGSLLATSFGSCAGYNRKQIYYGEQPQTLARHPNKNTTTGNFEWMNVGTVLSPQSFSSSSINDTVAAQRWMNDTTGESTSQSNPVRVVIPIESSLTNPFCSLGSRFLDLGLGGLIPEGEAHRATTLPSA